MRAARCYTMPRAWTSRTPRVRRPALGAPRRAESVAGGARNRCVHPGRHPPLGDRHYRRGGLVACCSAIATCYPARVRPSYAEWRLLQLRDWEPAGAGTRSRAIAVRARSSGRPDHRGTADSAHAGQALAARAAPRAHTGAVGRCVAALHERGVEHADLNAHNLLLGSTAPCTCSISTAAGSAARGRLGATRARAPRALAAQGDAWAAGRALWRPVAAAGLVAGRAGRRLTACCCARSTACSRISPLPFVAALDGWRALGDPVAARTRPRATRLARPHGSDRLDLGARRVGRRGAGGGALVARTAACGCPACRVRHDGHGDRCARARALFGERVATRTSVRPSAGAVRRFLDRVRPGRRGDDGDRGLAGAVPRTRPAWRAAGDCGARLSERSMRGRAGCRG